MSTFMSQPNTQTASGTAPIGGNLHPETRSGNDVSDAPSTHAQASTTTHNAPTVDYEELSRVMMPGLVQGVSNILGEQIQGAITELRNDIKQLPTRVEINAKIDGLRSEMNEKFDGLRSEVRNDIGEVRKEMHKEIQGFRNEVRDEIQGFHNGVHEETKKVGEDVKASRTDLEDKIQVLHDEMHEQLADVQLSMHGLADANMDELHNTVGEMQDEFGELRTDMHKTFEELRKDTIPVTQDLSNRMQDMNFRLDRTLRRHVDGIIHLRQITKRHAELLTEVGVDVMKMGTRNSASVENVTGLNDLRMKMAALQDGMRNNMTTLQIGLDAMEFNSVARLCNSRTTGPMASLYPLHSRANQAVPYFPVYWGDLASLRYDHMTSLANALNLPMGHEDDEADLRGRLARYIGLLSFD